MPITITRMEPQLYHARFSGQYEDSQLIETLREQFAYIQRFNDPHRIVVAELSGKWHYTFNPRTMQVIANYLRDIYQIIFVGWATPQQIIIRAIAVAFGFKEKLLFVNTLDEAILRARHNLLSLASPAADADSLSSEPDELQEKPL